MARDPPEWRVTLNMPVGALRESRRARRPVDAQVSGDERSTEGDAASDERPEHVAPPRRA